MISWEKKFLFIHPQKTGGTSIKDILKKYEERGMFDTYASEYFDGLEENNWRTHEEFIKNFRQTLHPGFQEHLGNTRRPKFKTNNFYHLSYEQYKSLIPLELLNGLCKFATIRNPFDRMISLYLFDNNNEFNRDDFVNNIKEKQHQLFNAWNPQVYHIQNIVLSPAADPLPPEEIPGWYSKASNVKRISVGGGVDFCLKFERELRDPIIINNLCNFLGVESKTLRHLNKNTGTHRKHYSHYYDSELRTLVEDAYCLDLEILNYDFEEDRKYFSLSSPTSSEE